MNIKTDDFILIFLLKLLSCFEWKRWKTLKLKSFSSFPISFSWNFFIKSIIEISDFADVIFDLNFYLALSFFQKLMNATQTHVLVQVRARIKLTIFRALARLFLLAERDVKVSDWNISWCRNFFLHVRWCQRKWTFHFAYLSARLFWKQLWKFSCV